MGFLRPKTVVMPAAAQTPVAESKVTPPPATIDDTFEKDGKTTTAKKEAEAKIRRKKSGMTNTILTSNQGDTSDVDVYSKSLLG